MKIVFICITARTPGPAARGPGLILGPESVFVAKPLDLGQAGGVGGSQQTVMYLIEKARNSTQTSLRATEGNRP